MATGVLFFRLRSRPKLHLVSRSALGANHFSATRRRSCLFHYCFSERRWHLHLVIQASAYGLVTLPSCIARRFLDTLSSGKSGGSVMRKAAIVAVAFLLVGCAATSQQTRATLDAEYIGHSVDDLVTKFGPPTSTFKMTTGSTAYSWTIANSTNIDVGKYGGTSQTFTCTLQAVADATSHITSLNTTDASNELGESLCAQRLGLKRQ